MTHRMDRILEKASDGDRERLTVLRDVSASLLEKYKKNQSSTMLKEYQAADQAYQICLDELAERYFSKATTFRNIQAVFTHLNGQGYKLSRSKLYDDVKKGRLEIQPDKTVREADIITYISKEGIERPADENGNLDDLHEKQKRLEIEKLERQNEKLSFDMDRERGKYILKSDVRVEYADKIGVFEAALKHLFRTKFFEWIGIAGGNTSKVKIILELAYDELDGLLNEMGNMEEIGVVITKDPFWLSGEE